MNFYKATAFKQFYSLLLLSSVLSFGTNAQVTTPTTQSPAPTTNTPTTTTQGQGTGTQPRTFRNDDGATRAIQLTDAEQKAITQEDSMKAVAIAEAEADTKRQALRRRIFGFNLFNTTKIDPNAGINIATPNNYVLGANDQVIIDINNDFGYSKHIDAVITPDGTITLPNAGVVTIGGLGMEQARRKIATVMSKFYSGMSITGNSGTTNVTMSLGKVRTIRVQVTGEVMAPGTYTATSLTSLLNMLYICGGPNEIGTYRQVKLIRNNEVAATVDLYDVLIKGYSTSNVLLRDQDVIQVGSFVSRIAVEGNVKRTGLFELLPGQRLIDAIDYAGGFNQYAYTRQVKIYRNTARERRIIDVPKIDFDAFQMQNGDSVMIERILPRFENLVTINGAIFRPGEYSLDNNKTLLTLIESAEGFREDALVGRVSIIRKNEYLALENISVNVADIRSGKQPDVVLRREDNIVVSSVFDLTEISYVRVQGAINNPDAKISVELPFIKNMSIEDVLVQVGGLTEAASLSRIEVVRRKRNINPNATDAQISDIFYFDVNPDLSVSKEATSFVLFPFDEIFVRTSPNYLAQTFASVEGEVLYPDKYGLQKKDEKISDLIERSGGLSPLAYIEGATLIRKIQLSEDEIALRQKTLEEVSEKGTANQVIEVKEIDSTKEEAIGIDLKNILENPGSISDMILLDGDVIRIPKRLETVRVQGEVLYPTSVKYINGKEFMDYISESGGFTKRSMRSRTYVLYPNGSVDRTRRFLFVNVYPKIQPGSEIIVPQKLVNPQQQVAQVQGFIGTITATLGTVLTLFTLLRLTGGN